MDGWMDEEEEEEEEEEEDLIHGWMDGWMDGKYVPRGISEVVELAGAGGNEEGHVSVTEDG